MEIINYDLKHARKTFTKLAVASTNPRRFFLSMGNEFFVDLVRWETHEEQLCAVRSPVFVDEQKVPREIEIDDQDSCAIHALASDSTGKPIGTGRLSDDGRIGRVAVLREWRGSGVGTELMNSLIEKALSMGLKSVYLHGQVRSMEFYEKLGFVAHGPEFQEADIAHREMSLSL